MRIVLIGLLMALVAQGEKPPKMEDYTLTVRVVSSQKSFGGSGSSCSMVLTIDESPGVTYYANQRNEFRPPRCFEKDAALKGRYIPEGRGDFLHTPEIRVLYYDRKGKLQYEPYYVSSEMR